MEPFAKRTPEQFPPALGPRSDAKRERRKKFLSFSLPGRKTAPSPTPPNSYGPSDNHTELKNLPTPFQRTVVFVLKGAVVLMALVLIGRVMPGRFFTSLFARVIAPRAMLSQNSATEDVVHRRENPDSSAALEAPGIVPATPTGAPLVRLGFVGDIMLARQVETKITTVGGSDYRFPFARVKKALERYDVLFGNLEGPISDKGSDRGSLYSFRMNPGATGGLSYAGFDVLSVANNHSGDWGKEAFIDTLYRLEDASISFVGGGLNEERAYQPIIKTVGNTRIAYLAFSQFGKNYFEARGPFLGLAVIDRAKIKASIEQARESADIVVVSFHFGDEYQKEPNDYQREIARAAIDFGADLVVGHHPHVVEELERYERGWIAYSLGNFIFDQDFSPETMSGSLLDVVIEHKAIRDATLIPVTLNSSYQPAVAE